MQNCDVQVLARYATTSFLGLTSAPDSQQRIYLIDSGNKVAFVSVVLFTIYDLRVFFNLVPRASYLFDIYILPLSRYQKGKMGTRLGFFQTQQNLFKDLLFYKTNTVLAVNVLAKFLFFFLSNLLVLSVPGFNTDIIYL